MPEESHTPGRIYVTFKSDGSDVKGIAKYGDDHKKLWEIHTDDHYGLKPHVHYWDNGAPNPNPVRLSPELEKLLNDIRDFNYE